MRGFTRRSAIALALVAALGVAACGGDDDSSGGGGGAGVEVDKMVWAIQSPVQSMDPAIMADVPTLRAQTAASFIASGTTSYTTRVTSPACRSTAGGSPPASDSIAD